MSVPSTPDSPPPQRHAATRADKRTILIGTAVVVVAVALVIGFVIGSGSTPSHRAKDLTTADKTLVKQFDAYSRKTDACEKVTNPYQCIEHEDAAMTPHLGTYASVLKKLRNAGVSQDSITRAHQDALNAEEGFALVGGAPPTEAGYKSALAQSNLAGLVAETRPLGRHAL